MPGTLESEEAKHRLKRCRSRMVRPWRWDDRSSKKREIRVSGRKLHGSHGNQVRSGRMCETQTSRGRKEGIANHGKGGVVTVNYE